MHFQNNKTATYSISSFDEKGNEISTTYSFNYVGALKAGRIGAKLASKVIGALSAITATQNVDNLPIAIENCFTDDTIEMLYSLIFSEGCNLCANGKYIQDPDIYFQGRVFEMYQLCGYALRCNCQDFFTTIGGWLKQNLNCSEILTSMKEKGIEIPEEIAKLLQIS